MEPEALIIRRAGAATVRKAVLSTFMSRPEMRCLVWPSTPPRCGTTCMIKGSAIFGRQPGRQQYRWKRPCFRTDRGSGWVCAGLFDPRPAVLAGQWNASASWPGAWSPEQVTSIVSDSYWRNPERLDFGQYLQGAAQPPFSMPEYGMLSSISRKHAECRCAVTQPIPLSRSQRKS